MMRSLFSGVSGLRVHQTKMDVIGNNISNVNTVGFKASRVTFSEVFSQTVSGASAANPNSGRGGVNPMQIGLGAGVSSIDVQMTQGASQRTDNPLDIKINGNAFFVVGDESGNFFTKAGAFRLDVMGNLTTPSGLRVMGWQASPDGKEILKDKVTPLTITSMNNMYIDPVTTKNIKAGGNLSTTDTEVYQTMTFFDSLGNRFELGGTFKRLSGTEDASTDETNTWVFALDTNIVMNGDSKNPISVDEFDPAEITLKFTDGGRLLYAGEDVDLKSISIDFSGLVDSLAEMGIESYFGSGVSDDPDSAGDHLVTVDFSNLSQFESKTDAAYKTVDGNTAGRLNGYSIGSDGIITGRYSNGDTKKLGQIAVASFDNPAGLEKLGDNLFTTTPNSGEFDGVGTDPQSGGGSLTAGVLEMSNVDLSGEFTEMITTQRGFQANSRIITVSDDMLQELVNLKR